ncbi:hypothetical protein XI06_02070 [Bradyrhizobium sp. CCBAU 11434]|nr:hypothetical protein [Bradyrhizobium sp. CCBAU 11434]
MTSALGLIVLASLRVAAEAGPCPSGLVTVCEPTPLNRPPQCHCERPHQNMPGSSTSGGGGGGKAEIHKHNVPTAKPNKAPGPND